MFPFV